jgi:hypothetical protein
MLYLLGGFLQLFCAAINTSYILNGQNKPISILI